MTIRALSNDEPLDAYADVMASAFENYPVAINAFRDAPGPRVDWIRRMVTGSAMARRLNGQPTLVAEIDGELVGGAALRFSHYPPPDQPSDWWDRFCDEAGPACREFFDRFFAATDSIPLPEPHLLLVMIGVRPDMQGRGIGRAMIEYVANMAKAEPGVDTVALDTEQESNVRVYEACGFSVTGQAMAGDMPVWVMTRNVR